jgi:hypothetical protein
MTDEIDPEAPKNWEIKAPDGSSTEGATWTLIAFSKSVVKGWIVLCQTLPGNCARCYDWLSRNLTQAIPRRCYPLRHKRYAGAWCYEVGSGERIYYRPLVEVNEVIVYYAGPHPVKVPYPPFT